MPAADLEGAGGCVIFMLDPYRAAGASLQFWPRIERGGRHDFVDQSCGALELRDIEAQGCDVLCSGFRRLVVR